MRLLSPAETLPAYGPAEAARYARLSVETTKRWADALRQPEEKTFPLSFANLLQLHLLKSMRIDHGVPLQRVRRALPELRQRYGFDYPLLRGDLLTNGLDLFLQDDDGYVNLSRAAQTGIREHFDLYLRRIEVGSKVAKLFPFVRPEADEHAPAVVVISPQIGFGQPTIAGTGISTRVVAGRFFGGESIEELMDEYGLKLPQVEEVLRWERQLRSDAA